MHFVKFTLTNSKGNSVHEEVWVRRDHVVYITKSFRETLDYDTFKDNGYFTKLHLSTGLTLDVYESYQEVLVKLSV